MAVSKWGRGLCLHSAFLRAGPSPAHSSTVLAESRLRMQAPAVVRWQQTHFSMNCFLPLTAVAFSSTRLYHTVGVINTTTISSCQYATPSGSGLRSAMTSSASISHTDLSTKVQHWTTTMQLSSWNSLSFRYLHASVRLRGLARRILPHGKEKKTSKKKVKEKRVLLIDLDGTNLGEMDGDMATKLSESKRADIVLASRGTEERCPVYKLISLRQIREVKKIKEKKDPRQITKEITISTKIDTHDLKVKVANMRDILTSLYNVRLTVGANVSRYGDDRAERLAEEMKKQAQVLKEVEEGLAGFGAKVAKESLKKNKLQCTFRSTVTASQDTIQK